jgi:hypothetical protein
MKKMIRCAAVIVAVVCVGFFAFLKQSGFTWSNKSTITVSHSSYLARGRWLADARTMVALVRYLYDSSTSDPTNPAATVSLPFCRRFRAISPIPAGSILVVVADGGECARFCVYPCDSVKA